jgi:hypothetical protein
MNNFIPDAVITPEDNNSWKDFYKIDNGSYWWYVNSKGEKLFIVYKQTWYDKGQQKKRFFQGSLGSNGRWIRKNLWLKDENFKLPLLRLNQLLETELPILFTEGESATDSAQKLFEDHFVTTYVCGKSSYQMSDLSVLKGREVKLWADSDNDGKGLVAYTNFALHLKEEHGVIAKLVPIPTYDEIQSYNKNKFVKKSWDLADDIPKEINVRELLEKAKEPVFEIQENGSDYCDIREYKKKFVYISQGGNTYWDRTKKRIRKEKEIDNLFLRSKERGHFTQGKASEWLQRHNIEYVDQTTFFPNDKEIIYHNGNKCINLYRKPYFKPLEENQHYDISWFLRHVDMICTGEEDVKQIILDTIASAVQRAEVNRTWALLIYSGQGCGKGALFETIAKLVGRSNSRFVRLNQLVSQFQAFLLKANNIFVREANSKNADDSQVQATLKELIVDDSFLVEPKGVDHIDHFCHYNVYLSTNQPNPIRIDSDDRRICYINVETPQEKILRDDPDYFVKLFENINNHDRIRELYHHFLKVHKISKDFNLKHSPWTKWKADLIQESKSSYAELLDLFLEEKTLPCLHYDLVNREQLYADLFNHRTDDTRAAENPFGPISKKMIQNWIHAIPGSFKLRSYAIQPADKRRGHYWVIRNFDEWRERRDDTDFLNQHFSNDFVKAKIEKERIQNRLPF